MNYIKNKEKTILMMEQIKKSKKIRDINIFENEKKIKRQNIFLEIKEITRILLISTFLLYFMMEFNKIFIFTQISNKDKFIIFIDNIFSYLDNVFLLIFFILLLIHLTIKNFYLKKDN